MPHAGGEGRTPQGGRGEGAAPPATIAKGQLVEEQSGPGLPAKRQPAIRQRRETTRYRINELEKRIKYSWIGNSICNHALFDHTKWWVRQLDCRSDHYPIFIQFDARCQQPPNHLMSQEDTRWDIKDNEENWTTFQEMLRDQWGHVNQ